MKLIPLDALLAWAKKTYLCENASVIRKVCYKQLVEHLNVLEVKEVELDFTKEVDMWIKNNGDTSGFFNVQELAKHFFELGMRVNNPITAADRGTAEEIIINLKRVEKDYRIDLTKEITWVSNKVQKGE